MAESSAPTRRPVALTREELIKVVVRLLPPAMTETEFFELVKHLTNPTTMRETYYFQGHHLAKPYKLPVFSRAYFSFTTPGAVNAFMRAVQDLPFTDSQTGEPHRVVATVALYPRMPDPVSAIHPTGPPGKKATTLVLANDPTFIAFCQFKAGERLEAPTLTPSVATARKLRLKEKRKQKEWEKRQLSKSEGSKPEKRPRKPKAKAGAKSGVDPTGPPKGKPQEKPKGVSQAPPKGQASANSKRKGPASVKGKTSEIPKGSPKGTPALTLADKPQVAVSIAEGTGGGKPKNRRKPRSEAAPSKVSAKGGEAATAKPGAKPAPITEGQPKPKPKSKPTSRSKKSKPQAEGGAPSKTASHSDAKVKGSTKTPAPPPPPSA